MAEPILASSSMRCLSFAVVFAVNVTDGGGLLAVMVEPLPALSVGEEAVARSALGRALERSLCSGNLNSH